MDGGDSAVDINEGYKLSIPAASTGMVARGRDGDVVDWTVLKSIQEANAASMRAMEEYLLVATHPESVGSREQARELLERSIDRHERIAEQLEAAAAVFDPATADSNRR